MNGNPKGDLGLASSFVNPSQILSHNAQAGPSSPQASAPSKRKTQANKRKRTGTPEDSDASSQPRKNRDGPKKKKANRACFHCQKAHLTCDDSRPCQRCLKRGIATSCTEGHRKKAKYLLDDEELEQLKGSKSSALEGSAEPQSVPITESFPQNESLFNASFDPGFSFGSVEANREYSILSRILGNSSSRSPDSVATPPPSRQQYMQNIPNPSWPGDSMSQSGFGQSPRIDTAFVSSYGQTQISFQPPDTALSSGSPSFMPSYPPQYQQQTSTPQLQYPQQYQQNAQMQSSELHPLHPRYPYDSRSPLGPDPAVSFVRNPPNDGLSRTFASPPMSNISLSSTTSGPMGGSDTHSTTPARPPSSQLQTINDRVTAPYDYTEGYHFLMKHLPSRFEKNDILRIVRALAIFRPSLIALQMPLLVEDEVFVERCFQRSLLELGKLISFSGTPTVVWRRTGEICLVAPEFCVLTEWSLEDLVGRRKYVYELFENQSVVEYWENFASHAFENTTHSVYSHCVLLKPSGAPIPATFCFSIRRDIFDLPSLVIGQWLPLL